MAAPASQLPGSPQPEAAPDISMSSHSDGSPSISPARTPHPAASPRAIGQPITFSSGPFEGQTVRAELCEIQKADAGRKFYAKDRRPLDPPPVAQLRLFVVSDDDGSEQEVADYASVQAEGWMCHLSMFRVLTTPSILLDNDAAANPSHVSPARAGTSTNSNSPHQSPTASSVGSPRRSTPPLGENVTEELMGTTFVQALKPTIDGRSAIVFAFIDVASKIEDMLCLRYQVFDLFHTVAGIGIPNPTAPKPIIASCVGGQFKVYNSKTFPGLTEVTALTKSLEDVGVFTGKRAAVRKRQQQNKPASTSTTT